MTKQIKFEGKIHSFPDDATDEEINLVLGGEPTQPSVGQDIKNIPEYAEQFIGNIPSEAKGALHMPLGRSLKNVAAGYLGIANLPHEAAKYYASRHVPYLEKLIQHYPWKADLDPNKYLGLGTPQPGDMALQALGPAGILKGGVKALGGSGASAIKSAIEKAPEMISKAGDIAPVFKKTASKPYVNQIKELTEKNLLTGYKPNINDILEAQRILTSPGMQIEHEAVNEAVANALKGDFKPWFRLQSSVRSEGRRLSKKGGVHNELGDKLHTMAERMHGEQETAQIDRGAPKAAAYQKQGKARTARYHKISPIAKAATGLTSAAVLPRWVAEMLKAVNR